MAFSMWPDPPFSLCLFPVTAWVRRQGMTWKPNLGHTLILLGLWVFKKFRPAGNIKKRTIV